MDIISIIIMIVAVLVVGGIVYYYTKKVTIEQATAEAQQAIQKAVTDERIAAEAAQKAAITKSLEDAKVAADAAQTAAISKAVADQKIADLADCQASVSKALADQQTKSDADCKASLDKAITDMKLASDAALKAAVTKTSTDIAEAAFAAQKAAVSKAVAEAQAVAREAQADASAAQQAAYSIEKQAAVSKAIADAQAACDAAQTAAISKALADAQSKFDSFDPKTTDCSPTDILNYNCFINRTYNLVRNPLFKYIPESMKTDITSVLIMSKSDLLSRGKIDGKMTISGLDDEANKIINDVKDKVAVQNKYLLDTYAPSFVIKDYTTDPRTLSKAPVVITGWFNMDTTTKQPGVLVGNYDMPNAVNVMFNTNRTLRFLWLSKGGIIDKSFSTPFIQGVWYHITIKIDSTKLYLYVNGLLTQTLDIGVHNNEVDLTNFYYGRDKRNPTTQPVTDNTDFIGQMYKISLYGDNLTDAEIKTIYDIQLVDIKQLLGSNYSKPMTNPYTPAFRLNTGLYRIMTSRLNLQP